MSVHQALVDAPGLLERSSDRLFRDLVEDHPTDRDLRLQDLDEVPRDRLSLAVFVGCEQELVRLREKLSELADDLLLARVDDVVGLEPLRHVHPERTEPLSLRFGDIRGAIGQISDVAHAGLDGVVASEVAGDRPCFRRGLDDDEALGHWRNTLAPVPNVAIPRYCCAWPDRIARAGSTTSSRLSAGPF